MVFALPGMLLSGFFVMVGVAGPATGMPPSVAAIVFGIALALGVLWVPVIAYLIGTRLTLDATQLELRQAFGFRVERIARTQIAGVDRIEADVGSDGGEWPGVPVADYDIIDRHGRRWTRLRTWVWSRSECERLRGELHQPGVGSGTVEPHPRPEPRIAAAHPVAAMVAASHGPDATAIASIDQGFLSLLQSAGCVVQALSMLIGFGLAAVIVSATFNVAIGRNLAATRCRVPSLERPLARPRCCRGRSIRS